MSVACEYGCKGEDGQPQLFKSASARDMHYRFKHPEHFAIVPSQPRQTLQPKPQPRGRPTKPRQQNVNGPSNGPRKADFTEAGERTSDERTIYECGNCKVHFRGQQSFCPGCGRELDWERA